jgi:hypothetical protein
MGKLKRSTVVKNSAKGKKKKTKLTLEQLLENVSCSFKQINEFF